MRGSTVRLSALGAMTTTPHTKEEEAVAEAVAVAVAVVVVGEVDEE